MSEHDPGRSEQQYQSGDGCTSDVEQHNVRQQQHMPPPPSLPLPLSHTYGHPFEPTYLHHQQQYPTLGIPVQYPPLPPVQFNTELALTSLATPQPQIAAPTPTTMSAPLHAAQIGFSAASFSVDASSAGHENALPAYVEQPAPVTPTPATAAQELVFIPANIDRIKRGYEEKSRKRFNDEYIPRRRTQKEYEVLVFRAKQPRLHRDPAPRIRPATPQSPIGVSLGGQRQNSQASGPTTHHVLPPRPPSSVSETGTSKRPCSAAPQLPPESTELSSKHKLEMLLDDPIALYKPATYTGKSEAETLSPITPHSIGQTQCAYEGRILTQTQPESSNNNKGKEPEVVCYPPPSVSRTPGLAPQPGIGGYLPLAPPEHLAPAAQFDDHAASLLALEEIAKVRSELDRIENDIHLIPIPTKLKLAAFLAHTALSLSESRRS